MTSSTTVYGAYPDNPDMLSEDSPLRPNIKYAREKAEVERMCERFAERNENSIVTTLRLCTAIGPHVRNPVIVSARTFKRGFAFRIDDVYPELQLVHEKDVVRAIYEAVIEDHPGVYNLAPEDTTDLEFIRRNRLGVVPVFSSIVKFGFEASRRLKLHYWQPSLLNYIIYRWTASSERIESEWGFEFKYTTEESLKNAAREVRARDVVESLLRYIYLI